MGGGDRRRGSRSQLLSLNLSHNEIADDDLTPLISIIPHPNEDACIRDGEGHQHSPVGLARLDLTYNRISHTYRTDTLATLSQSPLRGSIHHTLTSLFASTSSSSVSTTTPTTHHRMLADAVLEYSNRHRKGVAILC
eukprot:TRINITY_DN45704_c0_g1_i1.p1 TRINITY_DN45704_c0_g1~~TRINITY_DN45704_c0_g1_i1.p1  ORF type:complete len:137 (-),score=18.05 TRINITY_DN45704_c0_g1_i1:217-627(-)